VPTYGPTTYPTPACAESLALLRVDTKALDGGTGWGTLNFSIFACPNNTGVSCARDTALFGGTLASGSTGDVHYACVGNSSCFAFALEGSTPAHSVSWEIKDVSLGTPTLRGTGDSDEAVLLGQRSLQPVAVVAADYVARASACADAVAVESAYASSIACAVPETFGATHPRAFTRTHARTDPFAHDSVRPWVLCHQGDSVRSVRRRSVFERHVAALSEMGVPALPLWASVQSYCVARMPTLRQREIFIGQTRLVWRVWRRGVRLERKLL
jgi:hypothetical protein